MPAAQIYALLCPIEGDVRYIGKANNASKRLASHKRDARRRKTPVYDWMRKLEENELSPLLIVLEDAPDWAIAEREWINAARAANCRLLNLADGGDQPKSNPEQLRRAANTMNAKRPKNVMIAMRIFEANWRHVKKHIGEFSEAEIKARRRVEEFKELIAQVRQDGWLAEYDRQLGLRFPQWAK